MEDGKLLTFLNLFRWHQSAVLLVLIQVYRCLNADNKLVLQRWEMCEDYQILDCDWVVKRHSQFCTSRPTDPLVVEVADK